MVALPSQVMLALLKDVIPPLVQTTSPASDWHAVIGSKNTSPDNHVVIYDSTGVNHGRMMGTGENLIHHGIQILVRGKTYPVGAVKAWDIQGVLSTIKNYEVSVGAELITILSFTLTSPVTFAGTEEQNVRKMFTLNGTMSLRG